MALKYWNSVNDVVMLYVVIFVVVFTSYDPFKSVISSTLFVPLTPCLVDMEWYLF